jgi:hypothetical protein
MGRPENVSRATTPTGRERGTSERGSERVKMPSGGLEASLGESPAGKAVSTRPPYWRSLTRGEGRDLSRVEPDMTMHRDAADVGYGGTLGLLQNAGSPGLWEGRGFWEARDRAESITLRELRAVGLLLQRHFAEHVSREETRKILLHEDNQAVVYILNAMVSSSSRMMQERRRLQAMLHSLKVRIEARWIPSAVNRYADALSRQWDPGDVRATDELVRSLCSAYNPEAVVFPYRPTGEHHLTRRKYLTTQNSRELGRREGPPVEPSLRSSPDSGAEDTARASARGPHRASVGSTALVRAVGRVCNQSSRVGPDYRRPSLRRAPVHQPGVEAHDSRDGSADQWQASIRDTVLTLAGPSASGGAAAAADLLARHCWSANT